MRVFSISKILAYGEKRIDFFAVNAYEDERQDKIQDIKDQVEMLIDRIINADPKKAAADEWLKSQMANGIMLGTLAHCSANGFFEKVFSKEERRQLVHLSFMTANIQFILKSGEPFYVCDNDEEAIRLLDDGRLIYKDGNGKKFMSFMETFFERTGLPEEELLANAKFCIGHKPTAPTLDGQLAQTLLKNDDLRQ